MTLAKCLLKSLAVTLIAIGVMGCAETPPQTSADVLDPVDQEIIKNAAKNVPTEIPPGYTVNSGGELVPIAESSSETEITDDR